MGAYHAHLGQLVAKELLDVVDIALHVGEHLVEPLGAVRVGGRHAIEGEGMSEVELAILQMAMEALAQRLITDDRVGRGEARHIEGLAGRHQRDAALGCLGRHLGEGHMVVGRQGEVGMYLVGHNDDALAVTYLSNAEQLTLGPHTSTRVMGMTEEEELATTHVALEALEVNLILPVDKVKGVLPQLAAKVLRHVYVGVIHGGLYEYGVARLGEAADDEGYAGHDARHEVEPLGLDVPTVAALLPGYDGGEPARGAHGVSQDFVVETATQLVDDEGRCGKVHISYPEG